MQALKARAIALYFDESQARGFCFASDLIDRILRLMSTSEGFIRPVKLGNPCEFTSFELAEMLINLSASHWQDASELLPLVDPRQYWPHITLGKRELGSMRKVTLEPGPRARITLLEELLADEPLLLMPQPTTC